MLPDVGDFLDEVLFIELQREEADKLVKQYNEEGRKAGPPPEKRFDNRGGGGGGFRGRGGGGGFQRYDNRGPPGGNRGGFQNRGGSAGGGNYRGGEIAYSSLSLSLSLPFSPFLPFALSVPPPHSKEASGQVGSGTRVRTSKILCCFALG